MATPMTRRLSILIVAALLVVLAASCTAQPGGLVQTVVVTATPAARPEGAKTVLRVGTGDSGEGLTPHLTIIQQFEANNSDIQVQLEPVGSGDYYARILTQIAAGDPPDLLQIGDDAVPMFVDKGAFLPLDEFIAEQRVPARHRHLSARRDGPRQVERQAIPAAQRLLAAGRLLQQAALRRGRRRPIPRTGGRASSSWRPPRS